MAEQANVGFAIFFACVCSKNMYISLESVHSYTIFAIKYECIMSYKKVKDVIDELTKNNFRFVRQKGSHMIYTDGVHVVVVPDHGSKGVEKGTYFSILRQAGINK